MPTFDKEPQFLRDWSTLSPEQQQQFLRAVAQMVEDNKAKRAFRKGLRIKGVQGHKNIFKMTWADDGRATFHYGTSPLVSETHIIWRRIGAHTILKKL